MPAVASALNPVFEDFERLVQRANRDEIPALLGELERVRAMAWVRLTAPLHLPLRFPGTPETATIGATGAAVVGVDE